jgi:hypothetical protein
MKDKILSLCKCISLYEQLIFTVDLYSWHWIYIFAEHIIYLFFVLQVQMYEVDVKKNIGLNWGNVTGD